jgi:hypothetical protein
VNIERACRDWNCYSPESRGTEPYDPRFDRIRIGPACGMPRVRVGLITFNTKPPYRSFEGLSLPILLSLLLIVSGFVGVHIWRREVYGRFGTVGFVLAMVGAIVSVVSVGSWPLIFIGSYTLMIGSLVVGLAALVTNALPRWGSIVLMVGSVVFFLFNTETAGQCLESCGLSFSASRASIVR